jgi:hypothetical protein
MSHHRRFRHLLGEGEVTHPSMQARHMVAIESPADFSLLGGPLYQLGRRLGLVQGTNTILLGLTIGVGLWLVAFVLAVMQGVSGGLFTMELIGGHARVLVVIPLFFVCESWVDPRMAAFVRTIAQSGIVPPSALSALDAEVVRTRRWKDAWWPDAVCLFAAVVLAATRWRLQSLGETGGYDPARTALAALVGFYVGLTVFRFFLFRWVWKLALWCWFLWRVSRLDLHLLPSHPDRDGGLGSLQGVHEGFTPLVAAISVLEGASLAEAISMGKLAANSVYPWLALVLLVDGVLFLGPLLVFTDKLSAARTKAMGVYMGFAARYVTEFEAKWLGGGLPPSEPLLGTPDLQSLADLANAVSIVRTMRWVTIGPRLLTMVTLAALVPLAPLLLFQYPLAELAQKLFKNLFGF